MLLDLTAGTGRLCSRQTELVKMQNFAEDTGVLVPHARPVSTGGLKWMSSGNTPWPKECAIAGAIEKAKRILGVIGGSAMAA